MKNTPYLLAVLALCWFTGIHQAVLGFIGIGGFQYGISNSDPLGSPHKIHALWNKQGIKGQLGALNKPRKMHFSSDLDFRNNSGFANGITVVVGEEEYIQKISGAFVGTQHGSAPARAGQVELEMVALWKAAGGGKPNFKLVTDGTTTLPFTTQSGSQVRFTESHKEARFKTDLVEGVWAYSDRDPFELIELKLR